MNSFAVLDAENNYTSETIELPSNYVMSSYINLEKYPIKTGQTPAKFDHVKHEWVYSESKSRK